MKRWYALCVSVVYTPQPWRSCTQPRITNLLMQNRQVFKSECAAILVGKIRHILQMQFALRFI